MGYHIRFQCPPSKGSTWWRDLAHKVLDQCISQRGGIAWDDKGQVHAIVPTEVAYPVFALMRGGGLSFNQEQLILAGVATIRWDLAGIRQVFAEEELQSSYQEVRENRTVIQVGGETTTVPTSWVSQDATTQDTSSW